MAVKPLLLPALQRPAQISIILRIFLLQKRRLLKRLPGLLHRQLRRVTGITQLIQIVNIDPELIAFFIIPVDLIADIRVDLFRVPLTAYDPVDHAGVFRNLFQTFLKTPDGLSRLPDRLV